MFRLKSGEEINTNGKPIKFIKFEKIDEKDLQPRIIRTLISAEKPLRLSNLARESGIYKEKLQYNLRILIDKGLVLSAEEEGKKYYAPQTIFWDNDVLYSINERLTPIIKEINDTIDCSQAKFPDTPEPLINCLQMSLKLFSFEISEIKEEK